MYNIKITCKRNNGLKTIGIITTVFVRRHIENHLYLQIKRPYVYILTLRPYISVYINQNHLTVYQKVSSIWLNVTVVHYILPGSTKCKSGHEP